MATRNRTSDTRRYEKMREALATLVGATGKLRIAGREVEARAVREALDALVADAAETLAARAAYHRAVAKERADQDATRALLAAVRAHMQVTMSAEELEGAGIPPKRAPRRLTADERAAATVKLRATRAANGTLGVRQERAARARETIRAAYAHGDGDADADADAAMQRYSSSSMP